MKKRSKAINLLVQMLSWDTTLLGKNVEPILPASISIQPLNAISYLFTLRVETACELQICCSLLPVSTVDRQLNFEWHAYASRWVLASCAITVSELHAHTHIL